MREQLAEDLARVLHETRTTAVFVTHDPDEAFAVADRIGVMFSGKLVQVGTAAELRAEGIDRSVRAFLGN